MALTKGGISGDRMIVMIIVYTDEEAYNMYMPWTTTYKSNAHYKGSDQFVFLKVFFYLLLKLAVRLFIDFLRFGFINQKTFNI